MYHHIKGLPELPVLDTQTINDTRYYVLPDKSLVPSVTTVLGSFKKDGIEKWKNRVGHNEAEKIKNRAATKGTRLHNLLELHLKNNSNKDILKESMPNIKQSFFDISGVLSRHVNNIYHIEPTLYSTRLRLAGRSDLLAEYDGDFSVIDFKTATRPKEEKWIEDYFIQTTAYRNMYFEMNGLKAKKIVVIVSVDGNPEPQVFIKDPEEYQNKLYEKVAAYHKNIVDSTGTM